jgi:hypothetical protein
VRRAIVYRRSTQQIGELLALADADRFEHAVKMGLNRADLPLGSEARTPTVR